MAWTLEMYRPYENPSDHAPVGSRTNIVPGGIVSENTDDPTFTWERDGYRDCLQLQFKAVEDTGFQDNRNVRLTIDGVDHFYGRIVQRPHVNNPDGGIVTAVGAKDWLRFRVLDGTRYDVTRDISQHVREILEDHGHPAITTALPARFENLGFSMTEVYAPGSNLYDVLNALVQGAGPDARWGVDAEARPYTRDLSFFGTYAVNYNDADIGLRYLPILSGEVITRARLLLASTTDGLGADPTAFRDDGSLVPVRYRPTLVSYAVDHANHAGHLAERAFIIPPGADVLAPLAGTVGVNQDWTNRGNIFDGNPNTFSGLSAPPHTFPVSQLFLRADHDQYCFGVELDYWFNGPDSEDTITAIFQHQNNDGDASIVLSQRELAHTGPTQRTARWIMPPATVNRGHTWNSTLEVRASANEVNGANQLRIYAARFLQGDPAKLQPAAQALLRAPSPNVIEVVEKNVLSVPHPKLTITNYPGGTLSPRVALVRYAWGPRVKTTTWQLEQPESDVPEQNAFAPAQATANRTAGALRHNLVSGT